MSSSSFCQKIIEGILEEYKAYKNQKQQLSFVILCSVYKNCAEVYKSGDKISGVYKTNRSNLLVGEQNNIYSHTCINGLVCSSHQTTSQNFQLPFTFCKLTCI